MKKRIMIISFAFAVIVCTLTAFSMLIGSIEETKDSHGRMTAQVKLNELMSQMEARALNLDALSDEEYIAVAHTVCELVDKISTVTEAAHYFRNCFERAPGTLDEMMAIIQYEQGGAFGWKLMSRKSTRLHMFGRNGEYNMKFISADGHFEVVYNIDGVKLTKENDLMNMGTFNYGDPINEKLRHAVYDVLPFFEWRNSPEAVKQVNGLSDAPHPISKNVSVTTRFEKYWELLYGEKPQEMNGKGHNRMNMLYCCVALLVLSRAIHTMADDKYTHAAL
ncbi:MAG: hypothetical protein K0R90_957 [Oscillospiraceae bacterium]|nr:hypothetical protein [Oscillospiraceae bacterium]